MRIGRIAALLLLAATVSTSCGDSCGDIACLPAPTPLEVVVIDTVMVPITIRRLEGTDSIDVDTTVLRRYSTTAATVTIVVDSASIRIPVDTLTVADTIYQELNIDRIPDGQFQVRAVRNGRQVVSNRLTIQHVAGCCPYSIVGRYTLTLPDTAG